MRVKSSTCIPQPLCVQASMEDIQTKLSELLGREVKQVRRTDEVPPRISIIDVAIAVMGKTQHDAAQDFRRLSDQYPEVGTNCSLYKFKGRRQRDCHSLGFATQKCWIRS